MKKEKLAIIDLGTNTFHLLIAEKEDSKGKVILNTKTSVKIGQGGITKNFISSEAYERAIKALIEFKRTIDEYKIDKIYATATSAIRNARNGYQLIKDIKEKTGIEVNIISGETEADLIYHGVKYALDLGKSTSLIMDIGGGSVEFILCNSEYIFWKGSFEIGAQRLLDMFQKHDPITSGETENLINFLEEKLAPLFEAAQKNKPATLIGSSGTFDTLCDIDTLQKGLNFSIEKEKEYTLAVSDFERISFDLINKNREERMEIPGMVEMRVDMIVVASILIHFILHKFTIQKIRVSAFALKEGVLSKILKGENII